MLQNVALNKPASQSTTYTTWAASGAVDGNTRSDAEAKSCSHTQPGKTLNWLRVDLQGLYVVHSVKITNRKGGKFKTNFWNVDFQLILILLNQSESIDASKQKRNMVMKQSFFLFEA